MANVTIKLVGRKLVANSTAFVNAYNTYVQVATDNTLTIPNNGFAIESWDSGGGWHPSSVVLTYTKAEVPQAQLEEYYSSWQALGVQYTFTVLDMGVSPE